MPFTRCLHQHLAKKTNVCPEGTPAACDMATARVELQGQVRLLGTSWAEQQTGCKVPCTRKMYNLRKSYVMPTTTQNYTTILLLYSWRDVIRFVPIYDV